MQFAMGLRHESLFFFFLCILLLEMFNSKFISSTTPEQGSQVCNVSLVSGIYGVPDEHLSASSEYDVRHAARYGRFNTTFKKDSHIGGWAAKGIKKGEFIQVQLNNLSLIQEIQTQGRNNTGDNYLYVQYVKKYTVSYGTNKEEWAFVNDSTGNQTLFPGNHDQNSIKVNQLECPFEARHVRIITSEFNKHPSMRFDLIGCLLTEEDTATNCGFEDGLCGWRQDVGNDLLYWRRQNYTGKDDPSIPREIREYCTDNCTYLVLATKNYSNSNIRFRSISLIRFIKGSSTPRYLRVWSTVINISNAYINVTVVGCLKQSVVVTSKIVNITDHGWTLVSVDVKPRDYQLLINGGWTAGDQGYLAVDNILLIAGSSPGSRKFAFTEIFQNVTGLARLVGPVVNMFENMMFQTCLRFSYSIQGSANNTLCVYLSINEQTKSLLWSRTGSSQGWITQNINILNSSDFQIEFEAKVENGAVTIDDILVLYATCPELPITTSRNPPGSSGRNKNDFKNSDTMWIYLGSVVGFFTMLVALVITVICVIRRKRRTRDSKMGVVQLDDGKEATHLEECEYSRITNKSGRTNLNKQENDFSQIYENQCKPEAYNVINHSTPEVDQMYDHISPDAKTPNLNDATYDHATFGRILCEQIAYMPSDVPESSLLQMEDGGGENEETYSNIPIKTSNLTAISLQKRR